AICSSFVCPMIQAALGFRAVATMASRVTRGRASCSLAMGFACGDELVIRSPWPELGDVGSGAKGRIDGSRLAIGSGEGTGASIIGDGGRSTGGGASSAWRWEPYVTSTTRSVTA